MINLKPFRLWDKTFPLFTLNCMRFLNMERIETPSLKKYLDCATKRFRHNFIIFSFEYYEQFINITKYTF
jgi:hypothetical protein